MESLRKTRSPVWGLGNDDNVLVPGVRRSDVTSGEELRSFTGPQIAGKSGIFIFAEFLFGRLRRRLLLLRLL